MCTLLAARLVERNVEPSCEDVKRTDASNTCMTIRIIVYFVAEWGSLFY